MPLALAARTKFSAVSKFRMPCSQSITIKSNPKRARISTTWGDGIRDHVPSVMARLSCEEKLRRCFVVTCLFCERTKRNIFDS